MYDLIVILCVELPAPYSGVLQLGDEMKRLFAGILLALVMSLGLSAPLAHADGETITINKGEYAYECTTGATDKVHFNEVIGEKYYNCWSEQRAKDEADIAAQNSNFLIFFALPLIFLVGFIMTLED